MLRSLWLVISKHKACVEVSEWSVPTKKYVFWSVWLVRSKFTLRGHSPITRQVKRIVKFLKFSIQLLWKESWVESKNARTNLIPRYEVFVPCYCFVLFIYNIFFMLKYYVVTGKFENPMLLIFIIQYHNSALNFRFFDTKLSMNVW